MNGRKVQVLHEDKMSKLQATFYGSYIEITHSKYHSVRVDAVQLTIKDLELLLKVAKENQKGNGLLGC